MRGIKGAEDVKVEQATGLPFLEIKIDKTEIARLGLSVSVVQDVIGAAIGGREAGVCLKVTGVSRSSSGSTTRCAKIWKR